MKVSLVGLRGRHCFADRKTFAYITRKVSTMLDTRDILETIQMIREENLDIRTVTMGISLFDCVSDDGNRLCDNIYDKITRKAEHLVATGRDIEKKYGIPIVNKRVSVTPISLVAGNMSPDVFMKLAHTLQRAADTLRWCIRA